MPGAPAPVWPPAARYPWVEAWLAEGSATAAATPGPPTPWRPPRLPGAGAKNLKLELETGWPAGVLLCFKF